MQIDTLRRGSVWDGLLPVGDGHVDLCLHLMCALFSTQLWGRGLHFGWTILATYMLMQLFTAVILVCRVSCVVVVCVQRDRERQRQSKSKRALVRACVCSFGEQSRGAE